MNREIGESGYSAQAQVVIPFDLLSTVSAGVERNSEGDQRTRVNYSRTPPSDGGLGWNLGYAGGESEYRQADLTWRTSKAQLQAGIYQDGEVTTHWGGASGSLVAMQGQMFAANRIDDAFVVVSTRGYADVPVRFEHQLLGSTDEAGYLLVPWVPSYMRASTRSTCCSCRATCRAAIPSGRSPYTRAAARCWNSPWRIACPPASR